MQRLVSFKQLSRAPRSCFSCNSSSFYSLFNANPTLHQSSHPHQPHHLFSHYTTSCSRSWCLPNRVLTDKIPGFLSNPPLLKRVLPNANTLLKLPTRVGFARAQFQKRSFHNNFSFDSNRRVWLTTDGVVLGLIVTNVAVFLLWHIADHAFMCKNFMISLDHFRSGLLHTIITSAFSHIEAGHLMTNMLGLYFFGMSIGRAFGPAYLLKLYLSGAVVGSLFFLAHHAFMALSSKKKGGGIWNTYYSNPALGASGAVNAVMLLDIFLFPKSTLYLNFIIPVPAILMGIFLIGNDMLKILQGDTQISGFAHLGGAAVAAIAMARRRGHFRF